MSLSDLKFTNDKRPTPAFRANPTEKARASVLASINVQRTLLNAAREGVAHNLTKTIKTIDADGNITTSTVHKKPRQWFWRNHQGNFIVELLYSGQPVAINGKNTAIDAGSDLDGVEKVLQIFADATATGELDKALADAKKNRKTGRPKKAA